MAALLQPFGQQLVAYRLAPGQPKLYGYVVCEGEGGAPLEVAGDLVEVEVTGVGVLQNRVS